MQFRDMDNLIVKSFTADDIPQLLVLMRGLAVFEGYIDDFAVDQHTLIEWGLCADPKFHVFVAEQNGELLSYAACYEIPFTMDSRPTLVLKEMFALPKARGTGAASATLEAVIDKAKSIGAGRINWLVLPDNERAKSFYRKHGGKHDTDWDHWHIPL